MFLREDRKLQTESSSFFMVDPVYIFLQKVATHDFKLGLFEYLKETLCAVWLH